MRTNLGAADRVVRGALGIAVIGAGLYFKSWWGLWGWCHFSPLPQAGACSTWFWA